MARKLFSQIIVVLASFLILFGCALTPTPEPLVSEVEKLLEHEVMVGYIEIFPTIYLEKGKENKFFFLTQTPIGQKYLTMKQGTGPYSSRYSFDLTEYAKQAGAYREGLFLYIPIGNRKFEIVDQKITEYPGGEYICHTKFQVSLVDLNEFGQQAKAMISDLNNFNKTFVSTKIEEVTLYKNKESPEWQTRL